MKLFTSFPHLLYQGKIERYKDKWTGKINHGWTQRNLHKKMKALTIILYGIFYALEKRRKNMTYTCYTDYIAQQHWKMIERSWHKNLEWKNIWDRKWYKREKTVEADWQKDTVILRDQNINWRTVWEKYCQLLISF